MAKRTITEKTLTKTYRLDRDRIDIWDAVLPGFGLRVTARGTKTFFVMAQVRARRRRVTLGRYPVLSLKDARLKAVDVLRRVSEGEDPTSPDEAGEGDLAALSAEFTARHIGGLRPSSQRDYRAALRLHILPRFGTRAPSSIKRAEVQAMLDDIANDGAPTSANRTLAVIRKLFNWAVARGELDVSPCNGIATPAPERQRDRFLSMEELASVWAGTEGLSLVNAALVKMLALTGQRRQSVAEMRRSQIVDSVWIIPRDNMKGGRAHTVPLPSLALEIIDALPQLGDGDLVFTHDGERPVAGFSKIKRHLDATGLNNWRLHDLRRTAGTHIARLGFPRLVVSKILGHAEAGVTQIYELHSYDEEKRRALATWADAIQAAVEGTDRPSNVISLRS